MNKDAIPHHCLANDPHANVRAIRDRFGSSLTWFFRKDHSHGWEFGVQGTLPEFCSDLDYQLVHEFSGAEWISIGVRPEPDEADPDGLQAHESGSKLDAGKPRAHLVLGDFSRALTAVVDVGTHGALKYTEHGWLDVKNGEARYADAAMRHYLKRCQGREFDDKSGLHHLAHQAWNLLAELELMFRREEAEGDRRAAYLNRVDRNAEA